MNIRVPLIASALAIAAASGAAPLQARAPQPPISAEAIAGLVEARAPQSITIFVYVAGLDNPRGLKFGPDGALYVAEGGKGGTTSTAGKCTRVISPVDPYTGGRSGGRISKISSQRVRTTVTDQLPSGQTSAALGSLVSGVADVAFVGHTL